MAQLTQQRVLVILPLLALSLVLFFREPPSGVASDAAAAD